MAASEVRVNNININNLELLDIKTEMVGANTFKLQLAYLKDGGEVIEVEYPNVKIGTIESCFKNRCGYGKETSINLIALPSGPQEILFALGEY